MPTSPLDTPRPPVGWVLRRLFANAMDRLIVRLIELRLGTAGSPKLDQLADDQGVAS